MADIKAIIENWHVTTNLNSGRYIVPERRFIRVKGFLSNPAAQIKTGWIVFLSPPCGKWSPNRYEATHLRFPRIITISGSIYVLGEPNTDLGENQQWEKLTTLWKRLHGAIQFGYTPGTLQLIRERQK